LDPNINIMVIQENTHTTMNKKVKNFNNLIGKVNF
jgi:hypothetical protein